MINDLLKKNIWIFPTVKLLFLILCISILYCKGKSPDVSVQPPIDTITNCIVTDKSKLEDIAIFPADNLINTDISSLGVDSRSAAIMNVIGSPGLHPDFGSGLYNGAPIGIPFIVVCKGQTKIPIVFRGNSYDADYGNESDPGPYPLPLTAPIEANGILGNDNHTIAVDIDNKILYELYNASVNKDKWEASAGSVWDLKINSKRPAGWTSVDAAGMPILPVLIRYDEVKKGIIDHALRFTLTKAKVMNGYTAPASHKVNGTNTNVNAPTPMGLRIRLKASFNIANFSKDNQVILTAMKKYGLILTDIGSDLFIGGAPDDRWNNDDLSLLKSVKATDFEVVQMGDIVK